MVQKGDEVVLVNDGLGLSGSSEQKGDEVVVHDKDLARGPSAVQKGDEVVLLEESIAQGPSSTSGIRVGKITADDRLVVQGTEVLLFTPVTNTTDSSKDYTLQWTENGDDFDTATNTISANSTKGYGTNTKKSSPQRNVYGGPEIPNSVGVTWFQGIKPGEVVLDPAVNQVGGTKTISVTVENVGSESLDANVKIREQGGTIHEETVTISSGGSVTVSTTVTKNSETKADYTATVKEIATGLTGTTKPVTGYWTNDTVSYPGLTIGDSEMKNEDTTFYFNNGDKLPSGTYVLTVDGPNPGWTHDGSIGDGILDFAPWGTRFEPTGQYDSSYAIVTSSSAIFGPAITWAGGPFETGGGNGTYQADIFSAGTGTLVLDNSSTLGFYNMDEPGTYSDNAADLTYTLEKLPDSLTG